MTEVYVLVRSLGKRCGMAEYAGFVADRLGGKLIRSAVELPEANGSPAIVFAQLEYGIYGDKIEEMVAELVEIQRRGHIAVGDYASEPDVYRGGSEILKNYCILGPKYWEPDTYLLPLIRCALLEEPDLGPPDHIHLGSFGFTSPLKHHDDVANLAIRLGVPCTIIATVPYFGQSSEERELQKLLDLASSYPGLEVIWERYLTIPEVQRELRKCSHLISAHEDIASNWGPSGSLRTMSTVGRPLIACRSRRAAEVGAILVNNLSEVTIDFLEMHCSPNPAINDNLWAYTNLVKWLTLSIEAHRPIKSLIS